MPKTDMSVSHLMFSRWHVLERALNILLRERGADFEIRVSEFYDSSGRRKVLNDDTGDMEPVIPDQRIKFEVIDV